MIRRVIYYVINKLRVLLPPVDVLMIRYLAKQNGDKIIKLKPISVKKYCASSGGSIVTVEETKQRVVYEPPYYPDDEGTEHSFISNEIYYADLSNVTVHGGTGLVIAGRNVLTDICENDTENRVKYTCFTIKKGSKRAFYLEINDNLEEIDVAVNLCGLASWNYYHLTFEILSRYEYIRTIIEKENIVVLLDEWAKKYSQYEDLIKCVLRNADIKYVPTNTRIYCKKLIYPSMNTWMPINVRKKDQFRISDNLIAESAIENIRNATEHLRSEQSDLKIFISRKNATYSRIKNEEEVAELFKEAGYRIVCTEDLSFKEQIELFSSASCIVGASGAALTNLVYCNPETVFGCIIPKEYGFCIYSSIAHMVGCKVLFLDTKISGTGQSIAAEQWLVDLNECKGYIKELQEMQIRG